MPKVIQLQMSPEHQFRLGYQNPAIELEVEYLFGPDYQWNPQNKKEIIETVRKDMEIPQGYLTLKNYDVDYWAEGDQIHIFPRNSS